MAQLTIADKGGVDELPPIAWDRIEDDHSEDGAGYSFLGDDRNTWVAKGKDWVLERILASAKKRKEWMSTRGDNGNPYKARTVRRYSRTVEQFRERLWMIMHMVAGQHGRPRF